MTQNNNFGSTVLLFLAALALGAARAADNNAPPDTGPAPSFEAVCGDFGDKVREKDSKPTNTKNPDISIRLSYCKAVYLSQRSRDYGIASSVVWGATAATCTTACIASFTGIGTVTKVAFDRACMAAHIGAGVANIGFSIAQAQDLASGIQNIAMNVVGAATGAFAAAKAESCMGAGVAGAAMVAAIVGAATSGQGIDEQLRSAGKHFSKKGNLDTSLNSNPSPANSYSGPSTPRGGGSGGGGGTSGSQSNSVGSSDDPDICSRAVATREFRSLVSCANSGGRGPGDGLLSKEVADAYKNVGLDIQDIARNFTSLGDTVGRTLAGAGLDADKSRAMGSGLDAKLDQLRSQLASDSAYSGGGASLASKGGSDGGMSDLSEMLKTVMGAGAKKSEPVAQNAAVQFKGGAGKRLAPEDDPSVDIFMRVSTQYQNRTPAVQGAAPDAWTLPSNRASHGLRPVQ